MPTTEETIQGLVQAGVNAARNEKDEIPAAASTVLDKMNVPKAARKQLELEGLCRLISNALHSARTAAARRNGARGSTHVDLQLAILDDLWLAGIDDVQKAIGDFTVEDAEHRATIARSMERAWGRRADALEHVVSAMKRERAETLRALSSKTRLEIAVEIRDAWAGE